MTIRQALFQLEAEGLIYRLNRRGWFVSPPRLRYDPTANLSFTENALTQGRAPSTTVLSSESILASDWDREHLGIAAGEPVFLIRRVRSIDGRAVLVEHLHLDAKRCPGLLDEPLDRSMTEILAVRYGIAIRRRRIHMRPTALIQAHAQTLDVAAGTPSLYVTRATYDQFGNVVEFDQEFWRHDVLDIMVDVHTDDGHTDDGHTDDGHTDDGHTDDGHTDDGHTDDGHTDDGHRGDGGAGTAAEWRT